MSMTGFGTTTFAIGERSWRIDLKSVNHKNIATRLHVPAELSRWDNAIKAALRQRLVRGAIDLHINNEGAGAEVEVTIDHVGAAALMSELQKLATATGAPSPGVEQALRYGDFVGVRRRELSPDEAESALLKGIHAACDALIEMRRREGQALAADATARLRTLEATVAAVESRSPLVLEAMERRLRERLDKYRAKLGVDVDDGRIAAELVVFSDRADVTEETVRARTHIARFIEIVADETDAERGKRLDFLSQELLREFNTMGSKCRDTDIAHAVVDAKVELEKIREQVQNIV